MLANSNQNCMVDFLWIEGMKGYISFRFATSTVAPRRSVTPRAKPPVLSVRSSERPRLPLRTVAFAFALAVVANGVANGFADLLRGDVGDEPRHYVFHMIDKIAV